MTYIGNTSPSRFSSVPAVQRFSGNNSTTAFTLSTAIGSEQEILVSVDGVIQDTANYTVSGTTLTFSPAPSAGTNNIFVFTLSRAIASVTHPPTSALSATSGTFSGNVSVGGDLDVTGSLDMSDANLTNVGSIQLDSIAGDADANTNITFSGSDVITFTTGGSTAFTANANQSVTFSGSITGTTATLTTDDNLPQLTVVSTDADANLGPIIRLYRNSASPADGDSTGKIEFQAKTDTGSQLTYASLNTITSDVSNGSPDATFYIQTLTNNSHSNRFFISPTEIVLNEDSVDVDFRVESNGNANMLFVDGGNNRVGIGTNAPATGNGLVIQNTDGASGLVLHRDFSGSNITGETGCNRIEFTMSDSATANQAVALISPLATAGTGDALAGILRLFTAGNDGSIAERMRIDNSGRIGIGVSSPQELLHLKDGDIAVGNGTASNNAVIGRIGFSTDSSNSRFIGIESFRGSDAANADLRFHTFGGDGDNGERMRITTNGSVVIGATTTDAKLEVKHNVNATSTIIAGAQLMSANNYHDLVLGHGADYAVGIRRLLQQGTPSYLRPRMDFFVQNYNTYLPTDRVVRMTIHDTGDVSIGTTSTLPQSGGSAFRSESLSRRTLIMSQSGTGAANIVIFYSGGNLSGAINIQSGSVSYGSGSDYRIKENIVDLTDATTRLKQLQPKRFNFITNSDDEARDGFLAHEVSSIVPEAVIGEKDAVDENGEMIVQQLDPSKLVPLLTKSLQEAITRIETLETEVKALKG